MQLSTRGPDRPAPSTIPDAVRTAAELRGHAPAVTVLSARGREEQSAASLAQWAAKGAHLLMWDLELEPGDTLGVDVPLSWTTAAVCLAAWWAGVTVDLEPTSGVVVAHESRRDDHAGDVLWVGDTLSGAPTDPDLDAWVTAVQTFPDQPPPPRRLEVAVDGAGSAHTVTEVLALADQQGRGTAGVDTATLGGVDALVAVCLRPFVALTATVIVDGVNRAAADRERVAVWL